MAVYGNSSQRTKVEEKHRVTIATCSLLKASLTSGSISLHAGEWAALMNYDAMWQICWTGSAGWVRISNYLCWRINGLCDCCQETGWPRSQLWKTSGSNSVLDLMNLWQVFWTGGVQAGGGGEPSNNLEHMSPYAGVVQVLSGPGVQQMTLLAGLRAHCVRWGRWLLYVSSLAAL